MPLVKTNIDMKYSTNKIGIIVTASTKKDKNDLFVVSMIAPFK